MSIRAEGAESASLSGPPSALAAIRTASPHESSTREAARSMERASIPITLVGVEAPSSDSTMTASPPVAPAAKVTVRASSHGPGKRGRGAGEHGRGWSRLGPPYPRQTLHVHYMYTTCMFERLLFTTYYLLLTTYCLLLTTYYLLLTTYCLLLTAYYLLLTT